MIGNEPYWCEAPAASKPDTYADPDLIIDVDVNMDINSRDVDMVIAGEDPHQAGVVEDVIQEWGEVANPVNGDDVIGNPFIIQDLIRQPVLADMNQPAHNPNSGPAVAGAMDEMVDEVEDL